MSGVGSNFFRWEWKRAIDTCSELWERDRVTIFMFIVVNILIGQIGVVTSRAAGLESGRNVGKAWSDNLQSAAFYTFSISLLASSLALIASEVIDGIRLSKKIESIEYKVFWGLIAFALLVLQAPLAGNLISVETACPTQCPAPITGRDSGAKVKPEVAVTTVKVPPNEVTSSSTVPGSPDERKPESLKPTNKENPTPILQVLFWLASMLVAFQIFCLSRQHLIPENYAGSRTDSVNDRAMLAERKTETEFHEAI